jgi:hypothetical protein
MIRFLIVITALLPVFSLKIYGQRSCGTMNVLENQISKDSGLKLRLDSLDSEYDNKLRFSNSIGISGLIVIPVVVHVLYNKSAENIPDEQILSQIQILNEDFRRTNPDNNNTPSIFQGIAADVQIEFKLATLNPSGNPTTGIVRKYTSATSFSANDAMKYNSSGGSSAWNPSKYLNIWVCNLSSYLGYATFPGSSAGKPEDGIVVHYRAFGDIGTNLYTKYNLGRTATHEVGHYLNLRHIWGDGGCGVDDGVTDTPLSGGANYNGLPCTFPGPNSCNTGAGDLPDMFQNYMDYSDDACMNLFTNGQKTRMRLLFESGGLRENLRDTNSYYLELVSTESGTKTYTSLGSISSQSSILAGANITYESGSSVVLEPPFSVAAGATFRAFVNPGVPLVLNPLSDIRLNEDDLPKNPPPPPPFKVYPNPISRNGEFFIEYPMEVAGEFIFEIYSLNGSLVQPKIAEKIEFPGTYKKAIQPQNLFPGVYILRGIAGHQPFVQKIIIQP